MPDFMTRRNILHFAGAGAAGLLVGRELRAGHAPKAVVDSTKVITNRPHLYHGWPTLARRRNGELLVVLLGRARSPCRPVRPGGVDAFQRQW